MCNLVPVLHLQGRWAQRDMLGVLMLSLLEEEANSPQNIRWCCIIYPVLETMSSYRIFLHVIYIAILKCKKNQVRTFMTVCLMILIEKSFFLSWGHECVCWGSSWVWGNHLWSLGLGLRALGSPLCLEPFCARQQPQLGDKTFSTDFLFVSRLFCLCSLWGCLKWMEFICTRYTYTLPFIFIAAVTGLRFVCSDCKLQFQFFSKLLVTVLWA